MRHHTLAGRICGTCLAAAMAFGSTAYGQVLVPPISVSGGGQNTDSAIGPGGGNNSSALSGTETGSSDSGSTTVTAGSTVVDAADNGGSIEKPIIQAEGAVLMDAATGKILYGKNENTQYYPASITKIMTSLLVLENCSLDEVVTFSKTATTNLESGSVSLAITEGDKLSIEQSLHGLLLKSANEVANGLAEHVSGSVSAFADKMNQRAKELGCQNTNFANPSGLNNTAHKTTPYDMALIARAAFQNDNFCRIDTTLTYEFPATLNAAARTITMGHKMMYPSDSRYYEGIIGGKTGYTSKAGNTLVTGVERNGVRLIAVVMKSSSTHYTDTKALLDYGFANYQTLTDGTGNTAGSAGPGESSGTGNTGHGTQIEVSQWQQDSNGWYYIKSDGTKAKNELLTIEGNDYWFDSNEYMATGWRQFNNGVWYYFRSNGAMAKNYWVETEGVWFYLGQDGIMLTNTTTPDGHWVNEVGIWEKR